MCKSKCNGETPKRRNGLFKTKFQKYFGRSFFVRRALYYYFRYVPLDTYLYLCIMSEMTGASPQVSWGMQYSIFHQLMYKNVTCSE